MLHGRRPGIGFGASRENRKRRGLGKPEFFTFLGFIFICSNWPAAIQINGRPDGTVCGRSCKPSNRNCGGVCMSQFRQGKWLSRSSPVTSTITRCRQTVRSDRVSFHVSTYGDARAVVQQKDGPLGSGPRGWPMMAPKPANPSPLPMALCSQIPKVGRGGGGGGVGCPVAQVNDLSRSLAAFDPNLDLNGGRRDEVADGLPHL